MAKASESKIKTKEMSNSDFAELLQPLINKKELFFQRLQRLYDLSKNVVSNSNLKTEFNVRLKEIHSIRSTLETVLAEIDSINLRFTSKYECKQNEIETIDEIYYQILCVSENMSENSLNTTCNTEPPESRIVRPRLPKLELFHFDSNLENWQTFYDTFLSLIHNNPSVTNIEKYYYLLSAVSGSALTLVKSMPITSDNYPIVWGLLIKKFENKRVLATNYLDKLFQFKPLVTESASGLNTFLHTYQENVKALRVLQIPDLSEFLLFYISLRNLDSTTRREFEQSFEQDVIPTFQQLMSFVEKHVRVLEMSEDKRYLSKPQQLSQKIINSNIKQKSNTNIYKVPPQKPCLSVASVNKNNSQTKSDAKVCSFCNKQFHSIYKCFDYLALMPQQRLSKITELKLCGNCLRSGHSVKDCPSKITCAICKGMHHHTLHIDNVVPLTPNNSSSQQSDKQAVTLTCSSKATVLLGTALVHVADQWGTYHAVRAVIDSGAMSAYMTQDCAVRLGLVRRKCNFQPIGLGGIPVQNYGLVTCTIKPRTTQGPVLHTDTVVVSQITSNLPVASLSQDIIDKFKQLELADPSYYQSAPIDLLIAGDLFPYIYDGRNILPDEHGCPIAMHSIFGYVVTGQTTLSTNEHIQLNPSLFSINNNIDQIITAFWETENISRDIQKNPDDLYVERLFSQEHSRDSSGRYIVKYPFKPDYELGDSRQQAVRRLHNLESKLQRSPDLMKEYHKFMSEYESLGHMTRLGDISIVHSKYTIPHFCIHRPSSSTTKLRVVFDASSKTTNNLSLNSVLFPGPKLQADINEILINFRIHAICFTGDICKMFRMIQIEQSQRQYQHILWRFSQSEPIQVYELNTITYGVASSPYLAIRVLHQLADDEKDKYPLASKVLKKGFFVDDLLWSVPTVEQAVQLQDELLALLNGGGFTLRKWSSNNPFLLERVPADHRETPITFVDDENLSIKVLGLQWTPADDVFTYAISPMSNCNTKRSVLAQIGRQFDPLGFVAPCIFYAKCFMQKLWISKIGWDDKLPFELQQEWRRYTSELPLLSNFKHERQATIQNHCYYQLLGFCDASVKGYAAVVYLRSLNDNDDIKVSLIIAKCKVAPLKSISIPRLELMAAHLLAKLINYTKNILQDRIHINNTLLFTDSSVVLSWLNTPVYNLKTFVATRVSKILDSISNDSWYHINGNSNPADICSRGALPSTLLAAPEYLPFENWPVHSIDHFKSSSVPELKSNPNLSLIQTVDINLSSINEIYTLTEKYSSFTKLQSVIAWCFQFISNCRLSKPNRNINRPTLSIVNKAHDLLIKIVQYKHFSLDIDFLKKGTDCSKSLRKLSPFIDSLGFLRVGGRLCDSSLPYSKKHPLLLPKKSNFTNIIIDYYHKTFLHVGPRTLQSLINQKYWIISARSVIRSRILKCISCFKVRPSTLQPVMGNLPKFRIEDIHAFHTVGVDMAGPFYTKESLRRNAKISKSYLCMFVCFSTRAVHIEVVSALTTECFLAAFDRFTARRGLCHTIISDNAKNFVSASRQLSDISKFYQNNNSDISHNFNLRGVTWSFNPPTGSHFGGMYESAIKSAKQHLKRVAGNRSFTFEELTTFFTRVEAVLNSRPLTSISNDPREFDALTPGHFLVGRELLSIPEYQLNNEPVNRLSRWQLVQQASQQFWKLWRKDYLHLLQQRQKWSNKCRNIRVGELVLIHSDAPPLYWHLGRVTEVCPGSDGVVRVVKLRTRSGELIRPVVKISPLPIDF